MQVSRCYFAAVAEKLTDEEMEAWQALLHAHEQVTRRLDSELREEHGLGLSDYDVLLRLVRASSDHRPPPAALAAAKFRADFFPVPRSRIDSPARRAGRDERSHRGTG